MSTPESRPPTDEQAERQGSSRRERLWSAGRTAWSLVGILAAIAIVGLISSKLTLVIVPFLLALFPATLLTPVANWLKSVGFPNALAAITALLGGLLLIAGVIGIMIPLVVAELPELTQSARRGIEQLEGFLADAPLGLGLNGMSDLIEQAQQALGDVGELTAQAMATARVAFEVIAGLLLLFVVLFFFLKDGSRLGDGALSVVPAHLRPRVQGVGERAWSTLGSYFRGQLLVALVDAVAIGIGLLILGIPLAIPLAVLIFFGGLFPIVGAVTTGTLAVLVALADAGLVMALIVLGLVLAVQQLESNVLEPIILGRAIHLHPIVVLLSITAGAITLGILGAFLAVPIAAIVARTTEYLRGEDESDEAEARRRRPVRRVRGEGSTRAVEHEA